MNRIAAGEVIERPASVVKELVENAVDAGAGQIDVAFRGGGKSLIRVSDDGIGMGSEDLALAVERHATSKLSDDDLIDIRFLGFRGEALPSIGSVSRLSITSRPRSGGDAHVITVEGGHLTPPRPAALNLGTEIDVKDLFFATPARLKFLKADRTETVEAAEVVRELKPRRVIPVQYVSGKTPKDCDQTTVQPFLDAMAGTPVKRPGRTLSLPGKLGDGMVIEVMR